MSLNDKPKSSHWIDGPSAQGDAAMAYFGGGDRSQIEVLGYLFELMPVTSVVDMGTGRGRWLEAAMELGVADITGYDIPEIPVEDRHFPPENFIEADLSQPLTLGRKFDLAISTEVAEHLPRAAGKVFVSSLAAAADLILFSAALPYQQGAGHLNANWIEYWTKLFRAEGFQCFDVLRTKFWHNGSIRSYYRQNLLIFARGDVAERLLGQGLGVTDLPLSMIHPEEFLKAVGRALPPQHQRVGADVTQYYDCVTRDPAELDADKDRHAYGQEMIGWWAIRRHLLP